MNISDLIFKVILAKGQAVKGSGLLTNTESFAAALYAALSAIVIIANKFGFPVVIADVDLHTVANGWSATASMVYAIYRISTNPAAGFTPKV